MVRRRCQETQPLVSLRYQRTKKIPTKQKKKKTTKKNEAKKKRSKNNTNEAKKKITNEAKKKYQRSKKKKYQRSKSLLIYPRYSFLHLTICSEISQSLYIVLDFYNYISSSSSVGGNLLGARTRTTGNWWRKVQLNTLRDVVVLSPLVSWKQY